MRTSSQQTVAPLVSGLRKLNVSREILSRLGWTGFFATREEDVGTLALFLRALAREDCAHSWRTTVLNCVDLSDSELVESVLTEDRRHRPTTVFTYVAQNRAGDIIPVSVATVSDRVRADFPFDGFPVLARSFVLTEFRGYGLYPSILKYRLDYCYDRWGARLKAIHLGSADDRVVHTIEQGMDDTSPFLYMGDEWLMVANSQSLVRDYLALSEGFREKLMAVVAALSGGTVADAKLSKILEILITSGANGASFSSLSSLREQADQQKGRDLFAEFPALQEFMTICASIPIII